MNNIERNNALKELVLTLGDNAYIGFGNPESSLLILGKECAKKMDKTSEIIDGFSVQRNSKQWNKYLDNTCASTIKTWDEVPYDEMEVHFNPRFAFYGQKFHCRRKRKDEEDYDNGGTSRTWYFYQKLINLVRGNDKMRSGDKLDFQNYCFISDLSDYSKPMSNAGERKKTIDSIVYRSAQLFTDPFFQAFPVVLGAFGNYMTKEQLQQLFPHAIVIVSKQLSMNFSTEYLVGIAKEVADALKRIGTRL